MNKIEDISQEYIYKEIENLTLSLVSIRNVDKLDEDISNAKKHIHTKYNNVNEKIDILYSLIKYNGKIRLFIFNDYNLTIINGSQLNNDEIKKERKKIIDELKVIGIQTCILENENIMYYITAENRYILNYIDYSQIRVYSRYEY